MLRLKNILNSCDVYICGWSLYYLQGVLYPSGNILSQAILLCLLLYSLFAFFRVNLIHRIPLFLKAVTGLMSLLVVYGLVLIFSGKKIYAGHGEIFIDNFTYLKSICISLLPIYAFFFLSLKGKITEKRLRYYTLFFIALSYISFERNYSMMLQDALYKGSAAMEFTNNVGYEFVAIVPLVCLGRKRIIVQFLLLFVLACFVFMAMKRGAILIFCICLLLYLFEKNKALDFRKRIQFLLLLFVALYIGLQYLFSFYAHSDYFQERVASTLTGYSSGRDVLYWGLLEAWTQFDLFSLLFGKGANATISIVGNYAHNDWLELLINQGLVGVMIYMYFFVCLYLEIRKARKRNKELTIPLMLMLTILFLSSLFSMSYNSISFYLSLGLGYCLVYNNVVIQKKYANKFVISSNASSNMCGV